MTSNIAETHFHPSAEVCHHSKPSKSNIINILEKISALALGVFSAFVNHNLFLPFFFIGVCIGAYSYIQDQSTCGHHLPTSSCAHGLLEQLTGVKLPAAVSLAANIAVTVCHIDHHAQVFVPVIAVSLGAWIGKTASHYGDLTYRNFRCHSPKSTFC